MKENAVSAKKKKYKDILFEVKDQVAWITINRPRVMRSEEHTSEFLFPYTTLFRSGCFF